VEYINYHSHFHGDDEDDEDDDVGPPLPDRGYERYTWKQN